MKKTVGVDLFHTVFRWIKGSRKWRKASKCKSLIKQAQCRLVIQKARRYSIIRHSRADIAQLLNNGKLKIALARAEQLYKDQCLLSAYNQLDNFCDCIYAHLRDFGKHRELSSDVKEAVSSLIFAASRCGELPELNLMRNLFKNHLGDEFERVNVELQPGNSVSSQIEHNLSTNPIPDDVKLQLINEIAKGYTLNLGSQNNEQNFMTQPQELQVCNNNKVQVQASKFEEMLRRIGSKFSLSTKINTHDGSVCEYRMNYDDDVLAKEGLNSCNGLEIVTHHPPCQDEIEEEDESRPGLSHVHPKLPDYDELVAKFAELKNECVQQNNSNDPLTLRKWISGRIYC